ncbi:hypothetical protein CFN78_16555 [Amycolatopsis antarctica]|uniref:Uncharacterized protein n=1 Tax=Amycolatopsis antarctica TaxID=1854586 RepID=A0A263D1Z2_9PSEU|nr:hypothetical protein CFN78_16555 [Amycolatopsis antarctica]
MSRSAPNACGCAATRTAVGNERFGPAGDTSRVPSRGGPRCRAGYRRLPDPRNPPRRRGREGAARSGRRDVCVAGHGFAHSRLRQPSSRLPAHIAASLAELGFPVSADDVTTPSVVAAAVFKERCGTKPVLALGGHGVVDVLSEHGVAVLDHREPGAAAVLVGWDTGLDQQRLQVAAEAVWAGAPLLVTSDAPAFVTAGGHSAVFTGFIANGLTYVTGVPYAVLGKPSARGPLARCAGPPDARGGRRPHAGGGDGDRAKAPNGCPSPSAPTWSSTVLARSWTRCGVRVGPHRSKAPAACEVMARADAQPPALTGVCPLPVRGCAATRTRARTGRAGGRARRRRTSPAASTSPTAPGNSRGIGTRV